MYKCLEVKQSSTHGKGVFAVEKITKDTLLICDALIIPNNTGENQPLAKYLYDIEGPEPFLLCIGFGSYFNHKVKPNVMVHSVDKTNKTQTFIVLEDIEPGEEMFITYYSDLDDNHQKIIK